MRAGSIAVAIGAALALFLAPSVCGAFELRAWPLAEIQSNAAGVHVRLLGPLVEWQREGETRFAAVRPLFTVSHSDAGRSRGTLLYPLASWRSTKEETSVRFLGVGSYVRREAAERERPQTRELTIFPLLFYRRGPQAGPSLSLLPLYANLEHFFGYERVEMLAFPLFLKLKQPFYERTWLPFPFFSRVGGPAGEGLRIWPVYGRTVLGADYESRYVGWPFYIRGIEHPHREGQVTTRISWPFFSSIDGPRLHSRSYGFLLILPLYTHTIDLRAHTETKGFPWPFWTVQRDLETGKRLSLRLTPLYQKRTTASMQSEFYFWPFYRRRTGRGDDASYRRTDVMFVLYRDQYEGEGRAALHTRAVLPLWVSREGAREGYAQALTLLDGVFPTNESLRTVYAPLYRIYGRETVNGGTRRDILWRMWTWGDGKVRPPWYGSFR